MTQPALIRETFPVGPLQCNCTLIGDPVSKKALVVDPGGEPEMILARLNAHGLTLVAIIIPMRTWITSSLPAGSRS